MWKLIREVLTSKKAIAAIVGVIVAFAARYGLELPADAVTQVISPIVAYIIGQGFADFGKSAQQAKVLLVVSIATSFAMVA